MSNNDGSDSDQDEGRPEANLRVARAERDEAMKLIQGMARREAARDAGLDLKNPQHRFFVDKFDGKLEEMATQAEQLGFIASQQQEQQNQADASTGALNRATGAAGGQAGGTTSQVSTRDAALRDEANALMAKIKRRQVPEVSEVYEWARKAGVPFVGEDS